MSGVTVTKTRLFEGKWEGVVTGDAGSVAKPNLTVTFLERPVEDFTLEKDEANGGWTLHIPIPKEAVADGVQTVIIQEAESGETLETITLIAGDPLAEDIRVEVDLLRAELDMLKRAFRRHCVETM